MTRFTPLVFLAALSVHASDDPKPTCEIRGTNGAHNLAIVYTSSISLDDCLMHAREFAVKPLTDGTRILHPNNTATIKTWTGGFKKVVILYDSVDGKSRTVWKRDPGAAVTTRERVPENFWDCWMNGNCISR